MIPTRMTRPAPLAALVVLAAAASAVWAQPAAHDGMSHDAMPVEAHEMDHSAHEPDIDAERDAAPANHAAHDMMPAPADSSNLRDPHAYAGGYDFSQLPMKHEGGELRHGLLLVDRLEAVRTDGDYAAAYDLQGSYGGDIDRIVLKGEGEHDDGDLVDARTELLWSRAVAPYWNMQGGARHDGGEGPDRTWLAFGVQGLAPYWFEVDVTVYAGESGRTALNLEAEYDLLLTQKLILQPRIEADFYGKDDADRGLGSGLSGLAAGLRLRYEIRREFAPYVGVEWEGAFGGTADYAHEAGLDTRETAVVAGIRFWF